MAKPQPPKWRVIEKERNIHLYQLAETLRKGQEAWLLHMSDEHWDHPKCRLDVLKAHHVEAVARRALISKYGDTFCAMQGKGDPRGDKGSVREEHWGGNYLDLLVETAADWYAPYAENIGLIGLGNHETSVQKHYETCLVERLCQSLRDRGGITRKGGYSGFLRAMLHWNTTKHASYTIYYHHGAGGGGPVTKGAIDFNRMAEYAVADAFISGHVHYKNLFANEMVELNLHHAMIRNQRHYVRCGPYKDEFEDGHAGFHVERGRSPRPLGGWWQRFSIKNDTLVVDWSEAKA